VDDRRRIIIEDSVERAARLAAELLATIACEATSARGQFNLALAGGTTPHRLHGELAAPGQIENVPWQATEVFFGDERDVPYDHADSNYRRVQKALLDRVPIPPRNVHPMAADTADLDLAARRYAKSITEAVPAGDAGIPVFDLILLGMGVDGHAASLFPGTPALDERDKIVVGQYVPVLGRRRMTFTYPLINAARNVLFLVCGRDKADAARRVLSDDPAVAAELPAGRVAPVAGKLIFVLDREAARELPRRG